MEVSATGGAIVSAPASRRHGLLRQQRPPPVRARSAQRRLRWKFATRGRVSSSPAVAAWSRVLRQLRQQFLCARCGERQTRWKFATEGERRFSARHLHGAEPAAEVMPDPFDVFLSSPAVSAQTSTSAAAMAMSTRYRRIRARCAGSFTPATSCMPRRRSPMAVSMSAAGTAFSMHSMPRPVRSDGASRPARIRDQQSGGYPVLRSDC